ncbi:MAG: methyltransferase domain-containing protein [Bryobacterales bacterium]|nr:methyltransferase domain-containing protein [Bryobacterales bacterium]
MYPSWRFDVRDLRLHADDFRKKLARIKQRVEEGRLPWYPYDSLGAFSVLEGVLTGQHRYLLDLARGRPVLDLGCGDGDLAFLFESFGCRADAVDYAATNNNQMRGVRALKRELGSQIGIYDVNLDEQFELPRGSYGLALCLGVLYHIKNPYYLLEKLAKTAHYCLLSTRVAAASPDHKTDLRSLPVAYLVDEYETNRDPTNFWIFSEAGLKRILKRTGWEICDYAAVGREEGSDPSGSRRDQRVFCLLRSPAHDNPWGVTLLRGWHPMETGHFRWTEGAFSVRLERTGPCTAASLAFDFFLPQDHLRRLGAVTLAATVNGRELPAQEFRYAGECRYRQPVPPGAVEGGAAEIEFRLDKSSPPSADDRRELGVAVSFAREGCAAADNNLPLALE